MKDVFMKPYILMVSLPLLSLAACSGAQTDVPATQAEAAQTEIVKMASGNISVIEPYVVPPFPGRDIAAGFFDLENTGGADRLISASSPDSSAVEIHNHIEDNGVMRMRRIDGVAIGGGETVRFEQGGYHLMLFDVTLRDGQEVIDVTLNYENSESITLAVPIRQHAQPSYGSSSHGSGSADENAKGSGSQGSGSKGSGSQGSGNHYGSGSKDDKK